MAEIDFRGIAGKEGYGATVELVRALARVTRGEARARVAAAGDVLAGRGLDGAPITPRLPHTAAAVADHVIGSAEVEAELARHARTLDPGQLATLGKRILAYLDQDGAPPKDIHRDRRRLRFTDRDGGYELSGWLDREAAEIVRSALSPLAAPRPATDTEVDLRNSAQRDADALVELAQRALGAGELPTEGSERPQVVVTVPLAVLAGRIGTGSLSFGGPLHAEVARRIACDARAIPVVLGTAGSPSTSGGHRIRYPRRSVER